MEESWSNLMIAMGCLPQPQHFRLADLDPQPTDATARALQLATQLVEPSIVNHMIRTYYFALAINIWKGRIQLKNGGGGGGGDDFDREAFWVACLLHDVGISPSLTPPSPPDPTSNNKSDIVNADTFFEVRGGRRAHEFVIKDVDTPFSNERADSSFTNP